MASNVIITSCNKRYGDFLASHWLRSLKDNVDLSDCDIAIIDYGLTDKQREGLGSYPVRIVQGTVRGNIVNVRFLDAKHFLQIHSYKQVLFIDCGDIIFQSDISPLFHINQDVFRAVLQDIDHLFFETYLPLNFPIATADMLWKTLKGKAVINAGVVFAPVPAFIGLCSTLEELLVSARHHGSDQIILNYVLYTHKTEFLDKTYNYMLATVDETYSIRGGVFYRPDGSKVAIVHNAGRFDNFRPVANFGYGSGYNYPRPRKDVIRKAIFSLYRIGSLIKRKRDNGSG